ncbi:MAG: hypothetical protein ACQ5SW_09715, partial [Sphaerochaetaceae bacterium]
ILQEYGSITHLNRDGDAVNINDSSGIREALNFGSIDVSTHTLTLEYNKRTFAVNNTFYSTPSDITADRWGYWWLISVEEGNKMATSSVWVPSFKHEREVEYIYDMHEDGGEDGVVVFTDGNEVALSIAWADGSSTQNVCGRIVVGDPNGTIPSGLGSTYDRTPFFSNVCFDKQAVSVPAIFGKPLKPFVISAPIAWAGTQAGNDRVYIATPTNNGAQSFSGNINWEQVLPDPFSGDTPDPDFVSACFDQGNQTNSRSDLFFQDQDSEFYVMHWNGTQYVRVSTNPWSIIGQHLVRVYFLNPNQGVIVSRTGNTGNVAFQYIEYNSGDRFEQSSWIVSNLEPALTNAAKAVWFNGSQNSRPQIHTLTSTNGIVKQYSWNGSSWDLLTGSAVNGEDDGSGKAEEIQSFAQVMGQSGSTLPNIFTKARKGFNKVSGSRMFFDMLGRLQYASDPPKFIAKNGLGNAIENPIVY